MALTRLAHRFASRSRRIAVRVAAAALLLLPLAPAPPADADVVELRTGERVEGTFKGADDETVRIEVAGRVLTFKPQLVRAIYYGSVPSPAPPALPERGDALKALQAIRSVARDGVGYREYARQVGEAQTVVDRYLEKEEAAAPFKNAIADSFHLYALAGAAWNASDARSRSAARRRPRATAARPATTSTTTTAVTRPRFADAQFTASPVSVLNSSGWRRALRRILIRLACWGMRRSSPYPTSCT